VKSGPHVMLAVGDTGCGMDAEVRSHLFEPFFTTKEVGKGTGLGLSTVYGIVRQAGGHVWVYSEVDKGSVFKIYLPQVDEEIEEAGSAREAGPPARGTETVLLVEDEPQVRALTVRALRGSGYAVLEASDGEEALRVAAGVGSGPLDVLVTDVVMPRMGGEELAERIRALRPGVKVLFISGYTEHGVPMQGGPAAGAAFLQKPFTPTALAREIRQLIGWAATT
jgi:two-component system, cell cycle sensor histidine kinase and response regulator CckA